MEATVVLFVAVILAGLAIPSLQGIRARLRLEGVATQFETDVQFARGLAVARNENLRLSFSDDDAGSCYVVHTGSASACRCTASGVIQCSGTAQALRTVPIDSASKVRVSSNSASMLLDAAKGTVTPTGTVVVRNTNGDELRQVVNIMGRVRSCSPGARFAGYKAC